MTQYVVIEKDGQEFEVVKEAADDAWLPKGWTVKGEPTSYRTRDPFPPESSTAAGTAEAEDGMRTPAESKQEPEAGPTAEV